MWVVLRRIIEYHSRKAFHLHAFMTQKIMPRHFPCRKINFKLISRFIRLPQKYLQTGKLSVDSKTLRSGFIRDLSLASFNGWPIELAHEWNLRVTREPAAIFFVRRLQSTNDGGVKTLTTGEMVGRSRFVHLTQLHICSSSSNSSRRQLLVTGKFTTASSLSRRFRGLPFRHDVHDFVVLP